MKVVLEKLYGRRPATEEEMAEELGERESREFDAAILYIERGPLDAEGVKLCGGAFRLLWR